MSVESTKNKPELLKKGAFLLPNDLRGFSAFTSSKMSKMSGVSPSKDCSRSNRHWADTPLLVPLFVASCSNKRHSCHPRNLYLEVWTTFVFDKRVHMEFKSSLLSTSKPCLTQKTDATVGAWSENCTQIFAALWRTKIGVLTVPHFQLRFH